MKRHSRIFTWAAAIAAGLLWTAVVQTGSVNPAAAAETPKGPEVKALAGGSPLHVASDRMVVDQRSNTIRFEGHVVVKQDDLVITGKRLTVYAKEGADLAENQMMEEVERIEVEGEVTITREDKVARAEKAVFFQKEQKIMLSGNPRLMQGKNTVQGRLITLYLEEERSVVEGTSDQPVQAVLHPKRSED
ncbi:lipopolysaccharide transport periplasmic protein LptA [Desulfoglaeba alkanexedens]|uniref:Lipopolysaccharide transport periplasmic protein LptA n=1 Tax=Desulfoglaeba alkanexedens ALDC TaxID=980445 RepID=A0A4P8L5C4_9BACT|nr:lipopolysaccharide transport periplasmic protein LptA [Desulfoglaeba alkanexedens]QCQ23074.1 lipopolysaccharide transport periplasmic protein LptA [Desulfoglaeba alkanexedens ALDC]